MARHPLVSPSASLSYHPREWVGRRRPGGLPFVFSKGGIPRLLASKDLPFLERTISIIHLFSKYAKRVGAPGTHNRLTAGNSTQDDQGLGSQRDRVGQRR